MTDDATEQDASPVRLCCGQRHWTVDCLDGMVMCCLCFDRVTKAELHRNPHHQRRRKTLAVLDELEPWAEVEGRP